MPLRFTEFFYWVFYFARSLSLSLSPLLSLSILNVTEFYRVSSLFFFLARGYPYDLDYRVFC